MNITTGVKEIQFVKRKNLDMGSFDGKFYQVLKEDMLIFPKIPRKLQLKVTSQLIL